MANKKTATIKINSNIKRYAIENESGQVVTELLLDTTDDSTLGRFMNLYDEIMEIAESVEKNLNEIEEDESEYTFARKAININNSAMKDFVDSVNKMFGRNFVQKMFAEHYEINPDYVPSIDIMMSFFEQVMPIVTDTYSSKTRSYSVVKK